MRKKGADTNFASNATRQNRNIEINIDNIYGIKEHFYLKSTNDTLFPICDILQESGKVLLIHAHRDEWKHKISEISSNFPRLKIIVAHCARRQPFSDDGLVDNVKDILSAAKKRTTSILKRRRLEPLARV